jgi:hypothetical protein
MGFCPIIIMKHQLLLRVFSNSTGFVSDSQLLCCDLLDEMQNSDTETIDIGIGVFFTVIFLVGVSTLSW